MTIEKLSARHRRPTRAVMVGEVGVGGNHPIRVQSMTTPRTADIEATVAQTRRLVEAGCEIVRITVPTTRDAEALPLIRNSLESLGLRVPLVADIHFSPAAAMLAVEHVDKIRINPGNYADTKRFKVWEYTDLEYAAELERVEERFKPLALRARELGVSMRIGTNHGSLSDRILNRYGDTPLGMVESALEFVRICEKHSYRELILSMKSSNPMVMIQAYRLLAERMAEEGMDYPFHLGVTEAGDGEDGRVKSAIGIGSLLEDGIGDTIRVSLTEDPVAEIPVARALVAAYNHPREAAGKKEPAGYASPSGPTYTRRPSTQIQMGDLSLGGQEPVRVESLLSASIEDPEAVRREYESLTGAQVHPDARVEMLEIDMSPEDGDRRWEGLIHEFRECPKPPALSFRFDLPSFLDRAATAGPWMNCLPDRISLRIPAGFSSSMPLEETLDRVRSRTFERAPELCLQGRLDRDPERELDYLVTTAQKWKALTGREAMVALEVPARISPVAAYRRLAQLLKIGRSSAPILLIAQPSLRKEDALLFSSAYLGSLLCDGIGDALRIEGFSSSADGLRLSFNILQGSRLRLFKTEFISCPSCGRTQFDLEETTRRIRERTGHLKGVKIAIMGCIVNGPGEMADADFGYVGWGPEKVSLFVGKEMVEKDIPYAEADRRLVQLIQDHGRWTDPIPESPTVSHSSKTSPK